jgi:hypothetical protein
MKICPVGAELFLVVGRAGQTDRHDKLTVAFRNFANAPKKNTTNTKTLFIGDGGQITAFRGECWKLTPVKSERC